MNIEIPEYPEMVRILAKPGEDIHKDMTPAKCHILHMLLGVMGEVGEIVEAYETQSTREHKMEEFGDIEFYLEGLRQGLEIERDYVPRNTPLYSYVKMCMLLTIHSTSLLDTLKKWLMYNKTLDLSLVLLDLNAIDDILYSFYLTDNIRREEVLQANGEKLWLKRYPDGYSDSAAQERADKKEDSEA